MQVNGHDYTNEEVRDAIRQIVSVLTLTAEWSVYIIGYITEAISVAGENPREVAAYIRARYFSE